MSITYAAQRPSTNFMSKEHPKVIIGEHSQISIITHAAQRPSPNFIPKSIIGKVPFPIPMIAYAVPAPIFEICVQKYCWYHSHIPIIAYAIQRPSSKCIPKSIIGTIPKTNKNLRHPAPIFKTYPQNIVGTVPNTNNSLR